MIASHTATNVEYRALVATLNSPEGTDAAKAAGIDLDAVKTLTGMALMDAYDDAVARFRAYLMGHLNTTAMTAYRANLAAQSQIG